MSGREQDRRGQKKVRKRVGQEGTGREQVRKRAGQEQDRSWA
jgi:hypothetical protein